MKSKKRILIQIKTKSAIKAESPDIFTRSCEKKWL